MNCVSKRNGREEFLSVVYSIGITLTSGPIFYFDFPTIQPSTLIIYQNVLLTSFSAYRLFQLPTLF